MIKCQALAHTQRALLPSIITHHQTRNTASQDRGMMANPVANEISSFLGHYAHEPKAQQELLDFLRARPEVEQVSSLLPLHEYEIRLGIITQIRDLLRATTGPRDFQFTHIQFCYLIRMPQDELNRLLSQVTFSGIMVKELLKDLGELTGYCKLLLFSIYNG